MNRQAVLFLITGLKAIGQQGTRLCFKFEEGIAEKKIRIKCKHIEKVPSGNQFASVQNNKIPGN